MLSSVGIEVIRTERLQLQRMLWKLVWETCYKPTRDTGVAILVPAHAPRCVCTRWARVDVMPSGPNLINLLPGAIRDHGGDNLKNENVPRSYLAPSEMPAAPKKPLSYPGTNRLCVKMKENQR